jgi:glycosyltransferase involved in cell wall biosynthesis
LKIVVNAFSARLGGGQTYLKNLLAHLPQSPAFDIRVFAPPTLDLPSDPRLHRVSTRWPTENPLLRAVWERFVLPKYLRSERADILFCPGGVVATAAPHGCHVVTMFRNMIPFDMRVRRSIAWGPQRLRNWILQRVMLRSMARADLTIFISDHARGVIEQLANIRNAVTIPHGTSEAFRIGNERCPRPSSLPAGDYLVYVSRFDVYKHHQQVVEAYASLPSDLRHRFKLLLVGETESSQAGRVLEFIRRAGLGDQVQVVGAVPNNRLPAYYQHAHAVIFASSCENCPNILLEAMASGRPVLSSNVMPMPEFGGPDLAYFSPFEPKDIAQLLHRVLTDRDFAEQLGRAALERSQRYQWSGSARDTWREIFKLCANERSDH